MESILKKVNELEGMLLKSLVEAEKVSKENETEAKENKELRAATNKKAKSISEREKAIEPIEDIVEFKAKADKTMRDANKKMKAAGTEQDLADKKKAENLKEHSEQKARIALEDKRILDDKEGIKKGYAQLKDAEDKSESKLVGSFMKKIKKG